MNVLRGIKEEHFTFDNSSVDRFVLYYEYDDPQIQGKGCDKVIINKANLLACVPSEKFVSGMKFIIEELDKNSRKCKSIYPL